MTTKTRGYSFLTSDGGVLTFGGATFLGAPREQSSARCWVALSTTPAGDAYAAAAEDGTVALFGKAAGLDDGGGESRPAPIVDIDLLPWATGYRLLDAAGGVFCFGDATFHGSIPGLGGAGANVVGAVAMEQTPTAMGYWILDKVGGVYAFGDAGFFGSTPGLRLPEQPAPAVDLFVTDTGEGYCILEADGSVRAFGDAPDLGPADRRAAVEAIAFAPTGPDGYLVVDRRGLVYPVGMAPMLGSAAELELMAPVTDIAAVGPPQRSAL
jgi:hypothetical protein